MLKFDPRHYQLMVQTTLLIWGVFVLQFPIQLDHIALTLITAVLTQSAFCYSLKLPINPLSTLNTSLSILLLLHTESSFYLALAVIIAISSKFLIRFDQRHIFNPSNIGIVLMLLFFNQVWVAPGQWGQDLWLFLLIAGLALIAIIGLRAMLTSLSFLLSYILLTLVRAIWLGDPLAIPFHELQNGALLLFSFFMLSDPITTPSHPIARIFFGLLVSIISVILLWFYYLPNAFLYALVICSLSVTPLNRLLNHPQFIWNTASKI